ncbi:acyl carrier protein [Pseudomonas alkylphenolica]|uniref:Acyl carrier protein n=1 Tax=Pseudomonas alkylphenolica TaxID=237609 RepID=A0A443ZGR4_9PSED|nr:phosphopantetheine-binding protein [Pseudomonas alkylphenolica]RWU18000.1 acyl carrier protein [Pseudomonas alkylphenolica]
MSSNLEQQVIDVLAACLGSAGQHIAPGADLVHDLGCDSLNIVEMVEALNERFDQQLDPGAIRHWRLVSDVVRTVEQALGRCLVE